MDENLTRSLDAIPNDLQGLSGRVNSILGRLHQLRHGMNAVYASGSVQDSPQVDTTHVREELRRAKETILKFKTILASTTTTDPTSSPPYAVDTARQRQITDDPSRALIDRLGGELALETAVELAYSRFIQDSRLRAFFELNPRKVAQLKKRLFSFLLGYTGGKSNYNEANLKPTHYHLNITDYHLEAFLETFQSVLERELKLPDTVVRDMVVTMSKVRKEIVTGYTIRCELARLNTEQGMEVLFNKLGGLDGIVRFIDRLYDQIAVDHRIRRFFSGSSFETIKRGQRAYITELVGGPRLYKGRSLEQIHKGLAIDDYYFDCYLQDAEKALSWLGIEESTADQVLIQLESVRSVVLGRRRGAAQIIAGRNPDSFLSFASTSSMNFTIPSVDGSVRNSPIPSADLSLGDKFISAQLSLGPPMSLLSQLGGEAAIEAAVDTLFEGCLSDPRVRYFFLSLQAKKTKFKRSLYSSLVTVAGGPVLYDLTQLRASHFNTNITDYHFDTFMVNLADACRLVGVPSAPTQELVGRLSKLRSEITGGCMIRLEMAQQRTESHGGATSASPMCSSLGGSAGIQKVISKLYELVLQDPRILHFFQGSNVDQIVKLQGQLIANLFGANEVYTGRDVHKVHSMLNVADFHLDCFIENVATAVKLCGFSSDTADECTVLVETMRRTIVNEATRDFSIRAQRTLYDTIGKEDGCRRLGEMVVNQILAQDSAPGSDADLLRFTFEHHRDDLTSLHTKMTRFVRQVTSLSPFAVSEAMIGKELAETHFDLNVSDQHFEAFIRIVQGCLEHNFPAVLPEQVTEFVKACQPYRGFTSTGFRLRREKALERFRLSSTLPSEHGRMSSVSSPVSSGQTSPVAVAPQPSPFPLSGLPELIYRLGGEAGVARIVQTSLEAILDDTSTWKSRVVSSTSDALRFQEDWLTLVLRMVQYGCVSDLIAYHQQSLTQIQNRKLSQYHFDWLVHAFVKAAGADSFTTDEIALAVMEPMRTLVVHVADPSVSPAVESLFSRIGGESVVEQIVDIAVEAFTSSASEEPGSKLRVFFDLHKPRIRTFRRRLTRYFSAMFGGPSSFPLLLDTFQSNISGGSAHSGGGSSVYDPMITSNYLRQVHYGMNITDGHFDAVVGCVKNAGREIGLSASICNDMEEVLNSVRNEIVIGWTVRANEAESRRAHPDDQFHKETVFEHLGGTSTDPDLHAFLSRMYELIERDRRINDYFLGAKFNAIRDLQGKYIVHLLGGPTFFSRPLAEVHRIFNISNYHFDCFVRNILQAARDCGGSEDALDEIAVILEPFRQAVTLGSKGNHFST